MWIMECDTRLTQFFETCSRAILSLFIVALLLATLGGIGCTLWDLRLIVLSGFHQAFKTLLIDMLTVLAAIEILRTALAYFTEGRVKVTYIIDTVLVTVLTETMAFWHRDLEWPRMAMLLALVLTLAAVRVLAVRFSPRSARLEL